MTRFSIRPFLLALLATALLPNLLAAQDDAAGEAKPAADPVAAPVVESPEETVAAFGKLVARRDEIFGRLQELRRQFDAASDAAEKRNVRDQYTDLIREFDVEVYPHMREVAAAVYKADANNLDAAELVLQDEFNENRFETAAEIGQKLLAAGRNRKSNLNLTGTALFATHAFEDAVTVLKEAEKLNRLEPRSQTYLDAAEKYVDYWKIEQEVLAREAALEGDQALPRVELTTSKGKIVFELFEDQAPNTVKNFVSLVESGKYDGVGFHRYIDAFMVQGGDPNTLDDDLLNDGQGGPGYTIQCECYRDDARKHFRGRLSMAHAGPNSGGSQFFITHLPTDWLNPVTEPTQSGHTVFGRVVEGLDIASALRKGDKIEKAVVTRKRPGTEYKPEVTPDEPAEKPAEPGKKDE